MKVHLQQIPDGGLLLEGDEFTDILDLPPKENIHAAGPLHYALDIGMNAGGLWVTGMAEVDVSMECVRCLEPFVHHVEVPDIAFQIEKPSTEIVDLTPYIREDILLALPAHPRCDESGETVCPSQPLAAGAGDDDPDASPTLNADKPGDGRSAWNALDRLDIGPKH